MIKPTKFSSIMASQLNEMRKRNHAHQPLVSGRCKEASFYLAPLVKAILDGIGLQAEEQRLTHHALEEEHQVLQQVCAMPMTAARLPDQPIPFGEPKKSSIPQMRGGPVPIIFSVSNFHDRLLGRVHRRNPSAPPHA